MGHHLHVVTCNHIEYEYAGLSNTNISILDDFLQLFEIDVDYRSIDQDEYQIERSELQRLRDILVNEDETYRAHAATVQKLLKTIEMTKDKFITKVLDVMIQRSDQSDSTVYLSCF